jgi:hypothetical protein
MNPLVTADGEYTLNGDHWPAAMFDVVSGGRSRA